MQGKCKKNQKGFTIIETMLAVIVVTIGLYGGLLILQNVNATMLQSDFRIVASQLASEKLEMIMADKKFRGYDYIVSDNYDAENLSGANSSYTRTVTIQEVDSDDLETPSANSGVKKITVNVNWGNADSQNVEVSTVVSNYSS